MKRALILTILLAALCAACAKPIEQSLPALGGADEKLRHAAIVRLGKDGAPLLPKIAPLLASENENERRAAFDIVRRLGKPAMPTMIEKIGGVWKTKDTQEGFVEYFRGLGDDGYNALLTTFWDTGEEEGKLTAAGDPASAAKIDEIHPRLESVGFVIANLQNRTEVGRTAEMLRNPFVKARRWAAYVLCTKGWRPTDRTDAAIYYTHLMTAASCPKLPEPVDDAARLAAADLPFFLSIAQSYPAGEDALSSALAHTGTDTAAAYVYEQAVKAGDDFRVLRNFRILKEMETDAGRRLAKRLMADPKLGPAIRALDPDAPNGL